ncbi:FAD-dependent oxidoreductase [Mycobacterium sp. ITM-2016-00318]|uniref:FAD-dependent oxidoreductase n=1 Tax=Mycobacterium sp. ITM-2016-00318 TaxID=2099693 RepID=UPI000CF8BEED|nr:FAD-dependent oxidoreductase [Mycobacterium sp. ITM-2016-00318]WNG93951.1 FAD-dependent oxidoreductase [Mycobacterium sp. ITM-2016-00318]
MTEAISTPASCKRRRTVAVLGGGIAGLSAAHELAERGFDVTVYENRADERCGLEDTPAGTYPPIKLGGLAASQYSTTGPYTGSLAELRPFPGRRGKPREPKRAVAGEHGFRFFPAYYIHIWDLFQRIPVYERLELGHGDVRWIPTSRTIMDNVRRVVTQGTTVEGKPSLVFPREAPRSAAEFLTTAYQLTQLGFTAQDVGTFVSRLMEYLVTSPQRRASQLQNLSAYDFFVGRAAPKAPPRFSYSQRFDATLLEMPRVLAAFDTRYGDARTNVSTYLQLQLQMDRRDTKADGVLNGPTTESWFDHWYRHLLELGVRFVRGEAASLDPPHTDVNLPPHHRPRVQVTLTDGTRLTPDYTVVAVDAPAAERITAKLRAAGTGGSVARLDGFTTLVPPPNDPLQPSATRPLDRRDPYDIDAMGKKPWDRFQTLGGIQFYFDTEFQLLRGHMYYSGTEWALSSINQHGLWERKPILDRDGHISVLSVDIGDFNSASNHLKDANGNGKAARDCTADEIAAEVWRQIVKALTSSAANVAEALLPWPAWYAIDRGIIMEGGPGQGVGRPVRNETPYLIPIVGDWDNRPCTDPWNPTGNSFGTVPTDEDWLADLEQRDVWQARHGGFQVHNNSVVFAGTWTKTFTRMTSMEAACESGRHAVNAILDHYIWVESDGVDRRGQTALHWRTPYGFIDQGLTTPVRMPSPAGDYCYVMDLENREPIDTRTLRNIDADYNSSTPPDGGPPMTFPVDSNQHLLAYLQAWRQLLEASASVTPALLFPPGTSGMPPMPPMPGGIPPIPPMPPGMPGSGGGGALNPPTDYAQQLFSHLQAWRQYLEQAVGAASGTGMAQAPGHSSGAQPATAQPTASSSATGSPDSGASEAQASDSQSSASQSAESSDSSGSGSSSSSFGPKTDNRVELPPLDDYGTITDFKSISRLEDALNKPHTTGREDAESRFASSGSAFGAKARSAIPSPTTPGAARSLFRGGAGNTPTPTVSPAGQDPRRGAPPATSRWWEAGQGQPPGIAVAKPEASNLLQLRPTDLGGKEQ